jgi:hypothetical protein
MNMKIGIIVIGMMVIIASTAMVMAQQGDSARVWIEGGKVMFLHCDDADLDRDYFFYEIELTTTKTETPYMTEYDGPIGRDIGTGNAKLFTVLFTPPDHSSKTGDVYTTYKSDESTISDFADYDEFKADVRVYSSLNDEYGDGDDEEIVRLTLIDQDMVILPETDE